MISILWILGMSSNVVLMLMRNSDSNMIHNSVLLMNYLNVFSLVYDVVTMEILVNHPMNVSMRIIQIPS